ncbi:MAG TPA: M48 family metallopeptidase [Polyangia bacterium]
MSADAPDLFEQQEINRKHSRWLIAFFVWFFGWLGFGGDFLLREATRGGRFGGYHYFFPWLTVVMLFVGTAVALYALHTGARKVLWATRAWPLLEPHDAAEKQLLDVVEEMAIAAGIQRPQVYLVEDDDPNAFAAGRDESDARIVLTRGVLRVCTRDELQAVVAHEMGHIKNLDIRLMTLLTALVGAVALMSDGVTQIVFGFGLRGDDSEKQGEDIFIRGLLLILFPVWILTWLLGPLVTRLITLAVSRDRELLADAMSAQFTRNPTALATALDKIEACEAPTTSIRASVAHLCICDPLGRAVNARRGFWADLAATHPPMEERIAALKGMAYQGSEPAAAGAPAGPG